MATPAIFSLVQCSFLTIIEVAIRNTADYSGKEAEINTVLSPVP